MVKKKLVIFFYAITTAICLTGCQGSGQDLQKENAMQEKRGGWLKDDGSIMGQVMSVKENEITLALMETPQDGNRHADKDKSQPESRPKESPDRKGGRMDRINTSGEEKTITVSEETAYTINEIGESKEASLKDIGEGNMIRVVMEGDTATSVTIMNMGQTGNGNGRPAKNKEDRPKDEA